MPKNGTAKTGDLPIEFVTIRPPNDGAPRWLLAEAEVVINDKTLPYLLGTKLVRFAVLKSRDGAIWVKMPHQQFRRPNGKTGTFGLLRAVDGDIRSLDPMSELVERAFRHARASMSGTSRPRQTRLSEREPEDTPDEDLIEEYPVEHEDESDPDVAAF